MSAKNKQVDSGNLVSSGGGSLPERSGNSGQGEAIDPLIGQTIARHYQILSCRGKGGMSTVYKAKDLTMGRFVAIKFLLSEGKTARDQMMLRFQREGRVVGSLDHPNIISVHAFDFTADRQPFLVMDYVEGQTLAERINQEGMLPLALSLDIFIQICDGLAHAHEKGILHRDLKPGNIMLVSSSDSDVNIKILDFGIAKLVESSAANTQQLTRTGDVFGSPLYMSPEQGLGKSLTASSDLYSLGCLMFETLTGVPPFMGKTAVETILKHQTEAPISLKEATLGTEFPDRIQSIISTLLSKQPADRFQSARELGIALSAFKRSMTEPTALVEERAPVTSTERDRSLPVIAGTALIATISILLLIRFSVLYHSPHNLSSADKRAAQIIADQPKLSQTERDDMKVEWEAKYETDTQWADYTDYKLSATGFAELGKMKKLRSLDLTRTPADDATMKILQGLPILKDLYLDGTKVTDEGVKLIGKFNLASLSLAHTHVSNRALDIVKNMDLEFLSLRGTLIDDGCMQSIRHFESLKQLDLSETLITNRSLLSVSQLPELEELSLVRTRVTKEGLDYLKNLRSLNYLNLEGTAVTDSELGALSSLNNLKFLNLADTGITNAGLSVLARIPSLRKLDLSHTKITDQGLPLLLKLNNPSYLGFVGCGGMSKLALAKLKAAFPGCEISTVPVKKHEQSRTSSFGEH